MSGDFLEPRIREVLRVEFELRERDITRSDVDAILSFLQFVCPGPWHMAGNEVRDALDRTLMRVEHDNFMNPVPFEHSCHATAAFVGLARTVLPKLLEKCMPDGNEETYG